MVKNDKFDFLKVKNLLNSMQSYQFWVSNIWVLVYGYRCLVNWVTRLQNCVKM